MENPPPKPPPPTGSPLEIDTSGLKEAREREAARAQEQASRALASARSQAARLTESEQALKEAAAAGFPWRRRVWQGLRGLLALLVAYFLLSAFFDFVNFIAGVRILVGGFQQLLVVGLLYLAYFQIEKRLTLEQQRQARAWALRAAGALGALVGIYLLAKGGQGLGGALVYRTGDGQRWNLRLLYLLKVTGAIALLCAALWKIRRWALNGIADWEKGESLPEGLPPKHKLELMQFAAEGMILNLGLMTFFQFAFNVDLPKALMVAAGRPMVLAFYFAPFFVYILARRHFAGIYG